MADERAVAKEICERWDELDAAASTFKIGWQDIANYMNPERNDYIVDKAPGMKRMQYVFDATPILALEQAAAGVHARLTSPWLQWLYLHVEDDRINRIDRVRAWLEAAGADLWAIFSGARHNFASQSYDLYKDVLMIGTSAMAVLESPRSGMLFSTRHMKECRVAEDEEDRVCELVRRWPFTARQAVRAWGERAGAKVVKAYNEKPDTRFNFIHMVRPRKSRNPDRRGETLHKEFESVYVSPEDLAVISEGGFDEFPYLVPRDNKVTGEPYGRGRGWTALPDVKMLNEMVKTLLKAAQKIVDPPLQLPDDGFLVPVKTTPGSLNFYRSNSPANARIMPIETKGDIPVGIELVQQVQQRIRQIFTLELMRMPGADTTDPTASPGKGVTATFVNQDTQERGMMQSPMLARMNSEFTGPLVDRAFAIRWRQSVARRFGPGSPFPPPPPELSGQRIRVEYLSPIALMQKASELDAVSAVLATAQQLSAFGPQVAGKVAQVLNPEGILRLVARDRNAPTPTLNTPDQVAAAAQAQAEVEARLANHQALANVAGAAKDGSDALRNVVALRQGAGAGQQQEAA